MNFYGVSIAQRRKKSKRFLGSYGTSQQKKQEIQHFLQKCSGLLVGVAGNRKGLKSCGVQAVLKEPKLGGCSRNGKGSCGEGAHNIFFIGEEAAGNQGLAGRLGDAAERFGDGAGEDIEEVGFAGLAEDIFEGAGVVDEIALDGGKPEFTAAADEVLAGRDDAVCGGILADEVGGDIAAGEAIDEVEVDKDLFAVGAHLLGQAADVAHGAAEQENDGAVGGDCFWKPVLAFHGGDDGRVEQELGKTVVCHGGPSLLDILDALPSGLPALRGQRQRALPSGLPALRGQRQRALPSGLPALRGRRQRDSSLWNPIYRLRAGTKDVLFFRVECFALLPRARLWRRRVQPILRHV